MSYTNGGMATHLVIYPYLVSYQMGCQSYFWFMLSLEEAINTYFLRGGIGSLRRDDGEKIKWNPNWFPIFQSLHERLFHVVEIGKETSAVFLFDPKEEDTQRLCGSLTELLTVEADFFEEQSNQQPWLD